MLIYANSLVFEPVGGPDKIIKLVAKWVGLRAKTYVDAARLAEGIRELKLKDGSTLTARVTVSDDKQITYPFLFCAQLSHRDDKVSGRKWITEVGLRQEALDKPIECSLLLKTDEVSAQRDGADSGDAAQAGGAVDPVMQSCQSDTWPDREALDRGKRRCISARSRAR